MCTLGAINKTTHTHIHSHTYMHTVAQATIGDTPHHLSPCQDWVCGWKGRQSCLLFKMMTGVCD